MSRARRCWWRCCCTSSVIGLVLWRGPRTVCSDPGRRRAQPHCQGGGGGGGGGGGKQPDARLYFAPGHEVSRPGAGSTRRTATTRHAAACSRRSARTPRRAAPVDGHRSWRRRAAAGAGEAPARVADRRRYRWRAGSWNRDGTGPGTGGGEGGAIRPPVWSAGALPFGETPKALRGRYCRRHVLGRCRRAGRAGRRSSRRSRTAKYREYFSEVMMRTCRFRPARAPSGEAVPGTVTIGLQFAQQVTCLAGRSDA